ncbi:thiamine/thiamine pyrophosphate ABC transporter permease ThiP [Aliiroseovarius sp. KMU-50]|uniref:Thiamine/thiamine pyrophosphate ABC transporter permease ThiP n=1 Tax=Aliiroseovarius salicola TaxID=3009082 RepID=A0ABT4W3D5_9RHOB|nr:thiamine/thiamine pyrophosphate ABC transporter permease ThiP [Aliiroseovarius sp. KMU-50]MDA5095037.1 thiamine/thiamine pyrophosphate ABC transporter permease ThiP [Aliiroseovarius sp. KMU-50]
MARRFVEINRTTTLGTLALGVVVCLTLGTLLVVALRAELGAAPDSGATLGLIPRDWAAIRFTLWQAALSALFSVLLAIPVARALARRRFKGRGVLITLLGVPFILPVIVAIFGLISVFGRKGLVSQGLMALGFEPISIYGYHGVILAHVFFNLPLATRLILQGWLSIPAERFRLAASLGMGSRDIARTLERPMLREVIPGAFLVIFLICLSSFAVALALGGGPRATTVELAIYEAFRFDFDLGRAAKLALVQFAMGAAAATIALRVAIPQDTGTGLDRAVTRWDSTPMQRGLDVISISFAALFLVLPLSMILMNGVPGLASLPGDVWWAALRSISVALGSAALTLALALPIAAYAVRRGSRLIEGVGYLTIAASPLVIGTGLFIVIFPFMRPSDLALPVTALVNAAMSLPFALRIIAPAMAQVERNYGPLADGLGLVGVTRLRLIWLPRLRRQIGFSLGLAAALSMGDLGVIAMFANPEIATLPLQLYRLMSAYRMADAAAAAVLLLGLSLLLFWIFDRGGRADADT